MEQQQIKSKIEKIMDDHQIGTLATVENNRPYSRYMTFFHNELILYTATNRNTHKVDDIKDNPHVHILLGYTYDGTHDEYIEIEGVASIHNEDSMKEKLWNSHLEPWFDGPEDPNYTILKIEPSEIRLKNTTNPSVFHLQQN
ncbi:general stress protein 26 [Natronobacillus azotifigens]|uniref:Pyridoxamine 5'-phosphate oxidase family protein n=1 Tax=Natronobacillus azotifigens TaxID=472978 RepID=A0A9J6RAP8_9BACI|nr:pyridoxamine 5'-phosphate oxidase family protein [Natronobacillus azotifigens]MCZ0702754.1 pyridoxamine 5'-phosphate oxidase family protein [Natronobacillus azotifigens]